LPKYLSKLVVLAITAATRNSSDFTLQNDERTAKTLCARLYELEPTFAEILRRRPIVANKDCVRSLEAMQLMENVAETAFRKVNQLALSAKSAIWNNFRFRDANFCLMQCTIFR